MLNEYYQRYHKKNEEKRIKLQSRFSISDHNTLMPSLALQEARKLGSFGDSVLETGKYLLISKARFCSLNDKKHEVSASNDEKVSNDKLNLLYLSETDVLKEILFLFVAGRIDKPTLGGLFEIKSNKNNKDEGFGKINLQSFLFWDDIDIRVRINLTVTHLSPESFRSLIASVTFYLKLTLYLESWIKRYSIKYNINDNFHDSNTFESPGQTFQAFLSVANFYISSLRQNITSFETRMLRSTKDKPFLGTFLSFKKFCRHNFNCLDKLHQIFVSLRDNGLEELIESKQNYILNSVLLQILFTKLDTSFKIFDNLGYKVYFDLFSKTFNVYLNHILNWIYYGLIKDPFNEFPIYNSFDTNSYTKNDSNFELIELKQDDINSFWLPNYSIRPSYKSINSIFTIQPFPRFMEPFFNQILIIGKFLNLNKSFKKSFNDNLNERGLNIDTIDLFHSLEPIKGNPQQAIPIQSADRDPQVFILDNESKNINYYSPIFSYEASTSDNFYDVIPTFPGNCGSLMDSLINDFKVPNTTNYLKSPSSCDEFGNQGFIYHIPKIISFGGAFIQELKHLIEGRLSINNKELLILLNQHHKLMDKVVTLQTIYLFQHCHLMDLFTRLIFDKIYNTKDFPSTRSLNQFFSEACHEQVKISLFDKNANTFKELSLILNSSAFFLETYDFNYKKSDVIQYLDRIQYLYNYLWPLGGIVTEEDLIKYQKISHLLSKLKYSKYLLEQCIPSNSHEWNNPNSVASRHRLLYIINTLMSYFMTAVIHASTLDFNAKLFYATDITQLKEDHREYILHISTLCFIDEKAEPIIQAILEIIDLAIKLQRIFTDDRPTPKENMLESIISCQHFLSSTLTALSKTLEKYLSCYILAFDLMD